MKTLTQFRASLALFIVAMFALTSCETTLPPDPTDDGDYRNVFVGAFSFNWNYETVSNGDTNVQQTTYEGVIKRASSNQLDFEYRPGVWRRMVVDASGNLSEPNSLGEGYSSSGSMTTDAVSITVNYSSGTASSVSQITGTRN